MQSTGSDKPEKVNKSLRLLYISLGITFFVELAGLIEAVGLIVAEQPPKSIMLFVIAKLFITIAFLWFLIYMIGKGKNWARIILSIMVLLGTIFTLQRFLNLLTVLFIYPENLIGIGQPAFQMVAEVLQVVAKVLQIVAVVFLFQKPSSNWFSGMGSTSFDFLPVLIGILCGGIIGLFFGAFVHIAITGRSNMGMAFFGLLIFPIIEAVFGAIGGLVVGKISKKRWGAVIGGIVFPVINGFFVEFWYRLFR